MKKFRPGVTNEAPIAALELHLLVPFGFEMRGADASHDAGSITKKVAVKKVAAKGADASHDAGSITDFRPALEKSEVWVEAAQPDLEDLFRTANYLHPFVNRFWHNTNIVNWWQRYDVKKLKVRVPKDVSVTYDILQCRLMRVEPDIGLLHLKLRYASQSDNLAPLTWERMLYQINAIRRLYPPYVGATDHAHFPLEVTLLGERDAVLSHRSHEGAPHDADMCYAVNIDSRLGLGQARDANEYEAANSIRLPNDLPLHPIAPHWAMLLEPLETLSVVANSAQSNDRSRFAWRYRALGDERAILLTRISMTRTADLVRIDDGNWARLCFADKPGTDKLPYSQECLADFEARHCYDRWWYTHSESTDAPSRILNCGFAFHWVGSAEKNDDYFNDPEVGAPKIFETCYLPLAIIAVTQKTALLIASDRLAQHGVDATVELGSATSLKAQREFVETFYAHFVRFTQGLWHDEVTPQVQGMELFEQWRKHLRLQPMYNEVRQELQDMKAWVDQRSGSHLNDEVATLTRIAAWVGGASLLIALITMWMTLGSLSKDLDEWHLADPLKMSWYGIRSLLAVSSLVATIAAVWVVWQGRRYFSRLFPKSSPTHPPLRS